MEQKKVDIGLFAGPAPGAQAAITPPPLPTMVNDEPYVYEPLNTDQPQIRLIKVWHGALRASYPYPRTEGDEILCTIDAFEVGYSTRYIALSYTWGDPTPLHIIRLNGKAFSIRANLFNFLNAFGASEIGQQNHHLWIDQLCIEQDNKEELSHQVKMMGDIYRDARFVISWLDTSCYEAFRETSLRKANRVDYRSSLTRHRLPDFPTVPETATEVPDDNRMRAHMSNILSNRYFSRLWVVQEVLLAQHVQFMCGDVWIDWEDLAHHAKTFEELTRSSSSEFGARYLFTSRSIHQAGGLISDGLSLLVALALHSGLGCEDPRDKIYGLLGIVDASYNIPDIDYTKSVEQLYLDAIRIFLTMYQRDDFGQIVYFGHKLSHIMSLSNENQSALLNLFEDIHCRFGHRKWSVDKDIKYFPWRPPIIHAIGFDPPESPKQWWYEYDGVHYRFPVPLSRQQLARRAFLRLLVLNLILVGGAGLMLSNENFQYVLTFFVGGLVFATLRAAASYLLYGSPDH